MVKKVITYCSSLFIFAILILSFKGYTASAASPPQISIDNYRDNFYVQDTLQLTGVAANPNGINYVCVNYDGKSSWQPATINHSRGDISGYPSGSTIGFSFNGDVNSLSPGTHTVTVAAVGSDGRNTYSVFHIIKANPITRIENPVGGTYSINQDIPVYGWAVNPAGIAYVCISTDGVSWKYVDANLPSSGLYNYFNGAYKNADSGRYSYTIPKGTFSEGVHTIMVAAVGNDGETVTSTTTVNIDTPIVIDQSLNNTYVQGRLNFTGYVAGGSDTQYVCARFDGNNSWFPATATSRGDVAGYPTGSTYGFSFNEDVTGLSAGRHTVTVAAVGSSKTLYYTFTVIKASPVMYIDTPVNNSSNNYDVNVTGWALNASGIAYDCISVNGSGWIMTSSGLSSYGLDAAYNGAYKNANNCRLSYQVPKSMLKEGNNTITVAAVGVDGSTDLASSSFYVGKPAPVMALDESMENSFIQDKLQFTGFAANSNGFNYVCVDIDGGSWQPASISSRGNLSTFPDGSTVGFSVNEDVTGLSPGTHTVTVAAVGKDGKNTYAIFHVTKMAPQVFVNSPSNNSLVSSTFNINGYALNATGIRQVLVNVDGLQNWTAMQTGLSGSSVSEFYREVYKNADNSGYSGTISGLGVGKHYITVVAYGNDGMQTRQMITVVVVGVINNVNYSTSVSSIISNQIRYNTPTIEVGNTWEYMAIQNGVKGYTKDKPSGTFVADEASYNNIYSKLVYYTNPANLVNDNTNIFTFMSLKYVGNVSADGLNHFLGGVLAGKGQVFINAGAHWNVNPVYLAMHAILETGNGTSKLAKGQNPEGISIGYYNMFGIGAFDDNAVAGGNTAAQKNGWTSVDLAIDGGAKWISSNYINNQPNYDQDTLFKMRFDPDNPASGAFYCTDIEWCNSISSYIRQYYNSYGSDMLAFYVPQLS